MSLATVIIDAVGAVVTSGFQFGSAKKNKEIIELQAKMQEAATEQERFMIARQIEQIRFEMAKQNRTGVNLYTTGDSLPYIVIAVIVVIVILIILFTRK
jgi:hypothetical protein